MADPYNSGLMNIPSSLDVLTLSISCPCVLKQGMSLIFTFLLKQITISLMFYRASAHLEVRLDRGPI